MVTQDKQSKPQTQENLLEIRRKKSEMRAGNMFEYEYITRERTGLIPMQLMEEEEELIFVFTLDGLQPYSSLREEEAEYQYRFLENFYRLYQVWKDYDLLLSEDNLYYDTNFMPCIAFRDIRKVEDMPREEEFLEEYKKLTAGVLSRKFSYTQIQESGIEIVRKDRKAAFVLEDTDLPGFYDKIRQQAEEIYLNNKNNKVRLDKNKYRTRNRVIIIAAVVLLAVIVYTGYQTCVVLPRSRAVIQASRAYTVQDYVECIDRLEQIEPEQMDTYTKYILADSYARGEALNREELQNVTDQISIYSNETLLEYWIAIGRSAYDRAENFAQALSDDKLLVYAYMKELNYLEGNVTMDGEEKQNRMTELGNAIVQIGEKYESDED